MNRITEAVRRHCLTACHRRGRDCGGCVFEGMANEPEPIALAASKTKSFIELSQPAEAEI